MGGTLTQDSLEQAAQAAGIDAPALWRAQTGSTNTDAVALAERGVPEWTVVATGHQIAGRGRLGRTWQTPPGSALLVSIVLRPPLDPEASGLLGLLGGVALAEACADVGGVEARLKWPNDLLVAGRKLAGVLAEAKVGRRGLEHVVLGTGLNVSQRREELPPEVRDAATSLHLENGSEDQPALLTAYLRRLRARYRPEDPAFADSVVSTARDLSATLGTRVRATTTTGETVEGTATDLDPFGNLIVTTEHGPRTISFGEIAHVR